MRLKMIAAAACALFSVATAALADTHLGWYVAADAGAHQRSTQRLTVTDTEVISSSSSSSESAAATEVITGPDAYTGPYALRTKNDAAYFVRGGYQVTPNWRVELELGQRAGKINHSIASDVSGTDSRGKSDMASAMINVLYDVDPQSALHPFVGLGAGAVRIKTDYQGVATTTTEVSQSYAIHGTSTVAAAQMLAGLTWQVSDRLNLDLTWRYLQAGKSHYDVIVDRQYTETSNNNNEDAANISARVAAVRPAVAQTVTQEVMERDRMSGRFHDQSLTLGLRWAFGAPAAPAPSPAAYQSPSPPQPQAEPQSVPLTPAPSGPPARSYVVYFEFDRAAITADGQKVIDSAAGYAKDNDASQVIVTGYTDTSGSAAYNIRLSQKRAKAVASALSKDGVPAANISTAWKGETDPAVSTGDGVKEASNRRATIDFAF